VVGELARSLDLRSRPLDQAVEAVLIDCAVHVIPYCYDLARISWQYVNVKQAFDELVTHECARASGDFRT